MSLPFTRTEFLDVFAAYNSAIWPLQIVAAALGVAAAVLLFSRSSWSDRAIAAILGAFWLLMGAVYHWAFFTAINPAAWLFGALFVLGAGVLLVEGVARKRMRFAFRAGLRGWLAAGLMAYALLVYPLLGLLVTSPYPETPLFGVTPCPTTIFTIALLILAEHPRPLLLAGVPLTWGLIGGTAAVLLDVPQDWGLFGALLGWLLAYRLRRARPRI